MPRKPHSRAVPVPSLNLQRDWEGPLGIATQALFAKRQALREFARSISHLEHSLRILEFHLNTRIQEAETVLRKEALGKAKSTPRASKVTNIKLEREVARQAAISASVASSLTPASAFDPTLLENIKAWVDSFATRIEVKSDHDAEKAIRQAISLKRSQSAAAD